MPKTPDYFKGKTIVITGGGSGIGRATALIFAREGANVVCADINEDGVTKTAEMIDAQNSGGNNTGRPLALTIDVTKRAAVDDMIELALGEFGRVHFLFNSAGSAVRRSKFLDIDDDLFDRTFDLNVKGTFYAMQAVLPHMLEHKFGVIVNVASMAVKRGGPRRVGALCGRERRGEHDDYGRRARIRDARHPLPVDFAGADAHRVSGQLRDLAGIGEADGGRRADEALRRARGDGRGRAVHVLRRVPLHDGGHGVGKRGRRVEVRLGAYLPPTPALWSPALQQIGNEPLGKETKAQTSASFGPARR
jgi:NAD(P)-dependent dehydrogenase (short-subunit alcohol dehydrogenase family)